MSAREAVRPGDDDVQQRSRTVKSCGQVTDGNRKLATEWVDLLKRLANEPDAPIPIGTTDEILWEGFYKGVRGFPWALAVAPLLALRDLTNVGGYVVDALFDNLGALVDRAQPHLSAVEKQRLISWIQAKQLIKRETTLPCLILGGCGRSEILMEGSY